MKILCVVGTSYSKDSNFSNYYMAPGVIDASIDKYDKELIHPDARNPLYVWDILVSGNRLYNFTDGTEERYSDFVNPDSTLGLDTFIQYLERKLIKLGLFDKVINFSVGGFGIDTYYARIFNILQQHKHDELSFLCEVPGGNRENLHILEEAYEPWSQVSIDHYWKAKYDTVDFGKWEKRIDEYFFEKHRLFWSNWADGLTYDQLEGHYNKIKLSRLYKELEEIATNNNDILPSPEMIFNWNKLKVTRNRSIEVEDIIMQAFVINQFLKLNKHDVAWWSLDIDYSQNIDFLNNAFK